MIIETAVWYLVHTHSKQEGRAQENLVAWRVETLHPKIKIRRHNEFTGAPIYITQPLFPRYIFARFNAREQSKIRFTRGVHSLVCFGDSPARVSEKIIDVIRARIDQNGFVKASNDLKTEADVSAGPLRDLIEMFEREVEASERVLILLRAIEDQGRLDDKEADK